MMKAYETGILFVHGIQGKPAQFQFLIDQLPPQVCCQNVLLPGHGRSVREFRQADAEQWLSAVRLACDEMRDQCQRLYFVGHSMGCLLGLLLEQEKKTFSGMLLLCCPFYVWVTFRYLRNNALAYCMKRPAKDPFVLAAQQANGVPSKHALAYLLCARPYLELFRLIRRARAQALTLPAETQFYFSELDEIVSGKSLAYAQTRCGAEADVLPQCGHNYFTGAAQAHLAATLLEMLEK